MHQIDLVTKNIKDEYSFYIVSLASLKKLQNN